MITKRHKMFESRLNVWPKKSPTRLREGRTRERPGMVVFALHRMSFMQTGLALDRA